MLELLLQRSGLGLELGLELGLGLAEWENSFGKNFFGAGFCEHCFVSVPGAGAAADTSCVCTDGQIL